jgi:antitoxin MazE
MNTTIQKWGNSLALRIPRAVARQIHVSNGDSVELQVEADGLRIRSARRRYRLAQLVGKITPANRHTETEWGKSVGQEL